MFFIAFVSLFHYRFPIFSNICRYCEDMDLMWNVVIGTHRRGLLYLGVKIISSRLNSGILGMERLVLKHNIQAEGLDIAREKKKIEKKFCIFYSQLHSPATTECPKKFQPNRSSRLAGFRQHIYIYIYECLVFFYNILLAT